MKMNKQLKAKWIKALRSGEYQQGRNHLYKEYRLKDGKSVHRFCCLGVLEHIANDAPWVPYKVSEASTEYCLKNASGIQSGAYLTCELARKAKLNRDTQYRLASFNDGGHSFEQIAGWIEKNL